MLSEEDNNLASYREIVEREKSKVENDIELILKELTNMYQDMKLQMVEQLDDHYKLFVTRYMEFKSSVVDFKNIK